MKYFKILLTLIIIALVPMSIYSAAIPTSVVFQWDPNTETDIVGYKLYCSTSSVQPFTLIGSTNLTSLTVTIDLSTPQYCAVTAYNSYGLESDYSNVVIAPAYIKPMSPKNFKRR